MRKQGVLAVTRGFFFSLGCHGQKQGSQTCDELEGPPGTLSLSDRQPPCLCAVLAGSNSSHLAVVHAGTGISCEKAAVGWQSLRPGSQLNQINVVSSEPKLAKAGLWTKNCRKFRAFFGLTSEDFCRELIMSEQKLHQKLPKKTQKGAQHFAPEVAQKGAQHFAPEVARKEHKKEHNILHQK